MRKQRDAKYFGYGGKKFVRVYSLVLLLGWLAFLRDGHAQSQQQNYNATTGAMAGAGVMMGVGAGVCAAVTAGGCIPIAVAGGVLAGVGGTVGAMHGASGVRGHSGPYPNDFPDSDSQSFGTSDGNGSGFGAGGGGGSGFDSKTWFETFLDSWF